VKSLSLLDREPVAVINAVIGTIEAGIALAVAFGLMLNPAQVGAIMAFVVAIGTLLRIFLVRPQVTPLADPRDNQGNQLLAASSGQTAPGGSSASRSSSPSSMP
jgi:uncharacterized membrane protein YphA (DoxX/SURF4 family)